MVNTPSGPSHRAGLAIATALVATGPATASSAQQVAELSPAQQRAEAIAAEQIAADKAPPPGNSSGAPPAFKPFLSPQIMAAAHSTIATKIVGQKIPQAALDSYFQAALETAGLPVVTDPLDPRKSEIPNQAQFQRFKAGSLAPHKRDNIEPRLTAFYTKDVNGRVTSVKMISETVFNDAAGKPGTIAAMSMYVEGHPPQHFPAFVDPRGAQPSTAIRQKLLDNTNRLLEVDQANLANYVVSGSDPAYGNGAPINTGPIAKVVPSTKAPPRHHPLSKGP